jgi:hypothetical protein
MRLLGIATRKRTSEIVSKKREKSTFNLELDCSLCILRALKNDFSKISKLLWHEKTDLETMKRF